MMKIDIFKTTVGNANLLPIRFLTISLGEPVTASASSLFMTDRLHGSGVGQGLLMS